MSDVAIRCEGLSKQYRIGERERYKALRDTLTDAMYAPARRLRSMFKRSASEPSAAVDDSTFWALKDVSFEVKHGEVVGIIGRNGAGKSTLLKILSRITKPTEGHVKINGGVGSLLEVGTGFHPELTGRENIYLNGAILGMKRADIARKFDEIVAFAEIERFLDTPVKRYSSGMYVRLAFAVAVHLEPEVLIVDEVLAVGDSQFQKKCFQKMKEIGRGGRTILFVSHNMSAIRSICDRGLILAHGRIVGQGEIDDVVDSYLGCTVEEWDRAVVVETESFIVNEVKISSKAGEVIKTFDPVTITINLTAKTDIHDPGVYCGVLSSDQQRIAGLDFKDFTTIPVIRAGQRCELGFSLESLPILPGNYQLEIHLKDMAEQKIEIVPMNFQFEVAETQVYGGRKLDGWFGHLGLRATAIFTSDAIQ
ncbi:MAG TPA: polysaccharide ABC transporter ATP-binding protein [Pyrinomonadaceae bacterium]|jgi:lipopolysaccharide transport system ATP-binding protein